MMTGIRSGLRRRRPDHMGFPAGEDSIRKINTIQPAADIVAEMMAETRQILRDEFHTNATSMP
jgi:hypothetical protein